MEELPYPEPGDIFGYSELNRESSEIRLVYIEPSLARNPNGEEVPQCVLMHTPLADAPAYTALSYAWGDPKDTTEILVDGKRKKVTSGLATFLHHAAKVDPHLYVGYEFWIDAVSINQDDNKEKSQQVQIMAQIFRNAERVLIWLGPSSQDSDLAIKFIRSLTITDDGVKNDSTHGQDSWVSLLGSSLTSPRPLSAQELERTFERLHNHFHETLGPLYSLMTRPWWRRVWVQQEVALAHIDNVLLACGSSRIPWRAVVVAEQKLVHLWSISTNRRWAQSDQTQHRFEQLASWLNQIIQAMLGTCRNSFRQLNYEHEVQNLSLADVLAFLAPESTRHINMLASLSVDYVYSSLAIVSDAPEAAQFIRPDYSKPPEDVFIEVAKYLHSREGAKLFGLCGMDFPSRLRLPSWAPDFSCMRQRRDMLQGRNSGALKAAHWLHTASGKGTSFDCQIVREKMFTGGTVVDFIADAGVGNVFPECVGVLERDFTMEWLTAYDKFLKSATGVHGSIPEDASWRVPIADLEWIGNNLYRASPSRSPEFNEIMKYIRGGPHAIVPADTIFEQAFRAVAANRMPFFSNSGLVGLGPTDMQANDKLVIILGCDTPIVLRDADDGEYRIVGEAYVYGIMDGEVMERCPNIDTLVIV